MHYEETVINGVMHYRTTPAGEWQPMDAARLTAMVLELRRQCGQPVMEPPNWKPGRPAIN